MIYLLHTQTAHSPSYCINTVRIPNHQVPVDAAGADFDYAAAARLVWAYASDGVLVYRQQLSVRCRAPSRMPAGVCIAERRKRGRVETPYGAAAEACARIGSLGRAAVVEASDTLPSAFGSGKDHRLAVVSSSYDSILGGPCQSDEGKGRDADVVDRRAAGVNNADRTVVTGKRQSFSGWREGDSMYPPTGGTGVFTADRVKGQL